MFQEMTTTGMTTTDTIMVGVNALKVINYITIMAYGKETLEIKKCSTISLMKKVEAIEWPNLELIL